MKKQYLQTIVKKMTDAGIINDGVDGNANQITAKSEVIRMLRYVPNNNLENLSNEDFSDCKDFAEFREKYYKIGYLKFLPYVVRIDNEDDDNPSLCLDYDRFLHMFRGYYFQISGSPTGNGSHGNSLLRTDRLIKFPLQSDMHRRSKLVYMLLYAAFIDCGFQNDNFRETYKSQRDLIDSFFKDCMEAWWIKFDYISYMINDYITYQRDTLKPENDENPVYEIRDRDNKPYCRFRVTDKLVEVEHAKREKDKVFSEIITLHIPDVQDGVCEMKSPIAGAVAAMSGDCLTVPDIPDPEVINQMRYEIDGIFGGDGKPEHMLLLMLLKFVGVHLCGYTVRQLEPLEPIEEVNGYACVAVSEYRDIIK